jgi:nucleoside-diphosphate-sugar epimerase
MEGLASKGIDRLGLSSGNGSGIDPATGLFPTDFAISPGTSVVVYLAQSPRYRQVPEEAAHVLAVNSLSAVRAAILARAAGVERFIYVSTGTVYAPSFFPLSENAPVRRDNWYVLSKLHGEEALNLFRRDMEVIVVRPFGVYGPEQSGRLVPNLIDSVDSGRPISLQPRPNDQDDRGGLKISLCYVDDATNILIRLAMDGGPPCLNLAGLEALSIRSIAEAVGDLLGREPVFETSATLRDTDLIADPRLLAETLSPSFTSFGEGLARVIAAVGDR